MNRALKAAALLALAILVVIQRDELGAPLVNGHLGLALVCVSLCIGAVWNVARGMGGQP